VKEMDQNWRRSKERAEVVGRNTGEEGMSEWKIV
jgi:hypothetical protein